MTTFHSSVEIFFQSDRRMANGVSIKSRKKQGGKTVWGLRVRRKGQFYSDTFLTKTAAVKVGTRIAAKMDDGTYVPKCIY